MNFLIDLRESAFGMFVASQSYIGPEVKNESRVISF